ncbi:MAG: ribosome silencing factor [Clostridia bacterium]|nr:ribosome silencing factor [Clostridia bacterium]
MTSLEQAKIAAKALLSKKGINVKIIGVDDISSLADYFVIGNGTNSSQVKALAEEVEFKLDQAGISVSNIEGHRNNSWVLLDYVDVIVHVFSEEAREYYDLDRLWQDGKEIDISDLDD